MLHGYMYEKCKVITPVFNVISRYFARHFSQIYISTFTRRRIFTRIYSPTNIYQSNNNPLCACPVFARKLQNHNSYNDLICELQAHLGCTQVTPRD